MYPSMVVAVAVYMVARGYRLARASGYTHYLWTDGILATPVLLLFLLPVDAVSVDVQSRFMPLVLAWITLRVARIRYNRRVERADPERWGRWERALLLTPTLQRLMLRFPVQLLHAQK